MLLIIQLKPLSAIQIQTTFLHKKRQLKSCLHIFHLQNTMEEYGFCNVLLRIVPP